MRSEEEEGSPPRKKLRIHDVSYPPVGQLFVKTLLGRTICLEASPNDLVIDLKKQITMKIGILSINQKLSYGGKPLENDKPLGYYGIGKEATLHMVEILRGC